MSPCRSQTIPDPAERSASRGDCTCTVERRRRSAISPNPDMSAPPWPFPRRYGESAGFAAAQHIEIDGGARGVTFQHRLNVLGCARGFAAERGHNIADQQTGLRGRTARLQRKHDQTFVMIRKIHWLQADAEIPARHLAMRQD